ncbi:probable lipid phosphate phosphatase beta [Ipomoea triloba]|uniref:probable lipid phosphate phosphatase beta n=1 Tax=Ipomoea triloba TaxID=35885 RepID=UPI00125E7C47|nr:probable lipid phosphate phosphatase beta [Ipomoea triloba]
MESKLPPPSPSPSPPRLLRRLIDFDTQLSLRLYTLTHPILPHSILKTLEISGDGRLFFPVIISILLATSAAAAFLVDLLLGAVLDLAVIGILKHLIKRSRPVYNKNMFLSFAVDHWSFPSGHSSRVFFIATMFYLSFDLVQGFLLDLRYDIFADHFVYIIGAWAMVTSVSRILLGRHFVLDVVAGACLGVLEGLFSFRFFNYEKLSSFFK